MEVVVKSFYDAATSTVSHVVHGAGETTCAVIDPVLDFDMRSGRTGTEAADRLLAYLGEAGLPDRRQPVRPSLRRWRGLRDRRAGGAGAGDARPYPGLRHLCHRQCCLR